MACGDRLSLGQSHSVAFSPQGFLMPPDRVPSVDVDILSSLLTIPPLPFFRGGKSVNLWLTTCYLSLFTCLTIMVVSYSIHTLSSPPHLPRFPIISLES